MADVEHNPEEATRLTVENEDYGEEEEYPQELPPPPDGGYGWVICFASFMCNMIVDGIAYTFGLFLGEFVDYFKESKGTVAWVGSLLCGMYLLAGPLVSALSNKFGCRSVCIAGSLLASFSFVLSIFSTSVTMLMLTYGVMGGLGFGMIYLPAVVAVGYYFETKRSLATGIAVCGSGVGTFAFAPLANYLLSVFDWKNANLILAGLILNCAVFGALMRPLTYPKPKKRKPLMQRMYEEKQVHLQRGSISGSYFKVHLPDGTVEKRLKMPVNADPGVHSSLALDQLAQPNLPSVPTLPTITESKVQETKNNGHANGNHRNRSSNSESDQPEALNSQLPRNSSQPAFATQQTGLPKNTSVPVFDRVRKLSSSEKFKPSLSAIKGNSRNELRPDMGDYETTASKMSLSGTGNQLMVRPLSRKDIFYSGSVTNLKEYQSQKSLTNYRNSVLSLTAYEKEKLREQGDVTAYDATAQESCACLPPSIRAALSTMLDVSLLKNGAFMFIGISNIFGMAGLYVPFVYIVDMAQNDGIDASSATFLLSIIGIVNTFGRIICGYIADFPSVDALFLNNVCLVIATVAVGATPLFSTYIGYVLVAVVFGIAISGYISLTSIILVDLLGLDKLTNAFGLLILFRGAATIVGSPLAGGLYDATQSYAIPFFVAGGLFGLSAVFSFLAPLLKRCQKDSPVSIQIDDVLTPIEEDEEDADDQPIKFGAKPTVVAKGDNSTALRRQDESQL
ncbi:monocarboxylate transporter 14-like [Culicoides brevitarsis]|uniref:monocarboxylate transporter 14-like n=1 Tax=Culicoides brevitarsis TaxID=469753 RepID=UPI00307BE0F0